MPIGPQKLFFGKSISRLRGTQKHAKLTSSLSRDTRLINRMDAFMMLKIKRFGLLAGCALATGSLFAANYTEAFEGASASAWEGGELFQTEYSYTGITGLPLPTTNHTQVLVIEGDATCTPSGGTFTGTPMVDMMVRATLPDDALETPEGEAHIAVAVDTNGIFNVYCKNRSDKVGWYPLSSTAYADGTWARVSLLFDYANGRCQVRLDGQPMMTSYGYLNEATTDTTKNGAWYKLATATATSASTPVSNLKVVGCTAIDDVVIAERATNYAITEGAATPSGVSCAWLDQYGLGWDTTETYDNSGLTVAQKYDACLSPFDDQKFEIKSVKATATKTQVGIPATVAVPGRQVVLEYGSSPSFGSEEPVTAGATEVQIDLPAAGEAKYFRLKASKGGSVSN